MGQNYRRFIYQVAKGSEYIIRAQFIHAIVASFNFFPRRKRFGDRIILFVGATVINDRKIKRPSSRSLINSNCIRFEVYNPRVYNPIHFGSFPEFYTRDARIPSPSLLLPPALPRGNGTPGRHRQFVSPRARMTRIIKRVIDIALAPGQGKKMIVRSRAAHSGFTVSGLTLASIIQVSRWERVIAFVHYLSQARVVEPPATFDPGTPQRPSASYVCAAIDFASTRARTLAVSLSLAII